MDAKKRTFIAIIIDAITFIAILLLMQLLKQIRKDMDTFQIELKIASLVAQRMYTLRNIFQILLH